MKKLRKTLFELLPTISSVDDARYLSPALVALCRDWQDESVLSACVQFTEKFSDNDPELQFSLARLYRQAARNKEANTLLAGIAASHPNTDFEKLSLLDQYYAAHASASVASEPGVIEGLLQNKYADDPAVQQALWVYGQKDQAKPTVPQLQATGPTTSISAVSLESYPNPFNPTTNVAYRVTKAGFVSLKVFDVLGREVATLVNEEKAVGTYSVQFDASHLASGIYFARLQAGSYLATRKLSLVK